MTWKDLLLMLRQLWCFDWYHYHHEGSRVIDTGLYLTYSNTSGRVGEVLDSRDKEEEEIEGFQYRHAEMFVVSNADGRPAFSLKWVNKNHKNSLGKPNSKE